MKKQLLTKNKAGIINTAAGIMVVVISLYLSGCIHRETVSSPVQPETPASSKVEAPAAKNPVESKTEDQKPVKTADTTPKAPETLSATRDKTVNAEEAGRLIDDYVKRLPFKSNLEMQEERETYQGHTFYVFHGYEYIVDDKATGEGHRSTWGWFYVDVSNGAIYEADLAEMVLKPVGGKVVPQKTIKME